MQETERTVFQVTILGPNKGLFPTSVIKMGHGQLPLTDAAVALATI